MLKRGIGLSLGSGLALVFKFPENLEFPGSSRVLNRLSHDKLFGCLLRPAKIEIGDRNPVVSVVITWMCVVLVFLVGAMNKIAKLTSIFFLLSYMGVNVATLALELTSAPNFR